MSADPVADNSFSPSRTAPTVGCPPVLKISHARDAIAAALCAPTPVGVIDTAHGGMAVLSGEPR
jgi:hypothetical protein